MEVAEYEKMDKLEADHWWFKAKREFLKVALNKYTKQLGQALDVGCGTGAVLKMLEQAGWQARGVDMSPDAIKYCEAKNLSVNIGFADKINFPDDTFDLVIASDVLEHLENDAAAVKEIRRVLKPGGIFIVTVPAHQFLFSYHDAALHHFRRYSKNDFKKLLSGQLKIIKVSWVHSLILLPAILLRLISKFLKRPGSRSDVVDTGKLINKVMGAWYIVELWIFRKTLHLPFGLTLIAVTKK